MAGPEELKRSVVEELYWDSRVDASEVTVEVADGTVKLGGAVTSLGGRRAAEDDVWGMPGVRTVENNIIIKRPPTAAELGDEALAARVAELLLFDPDIDATRVRVDARDGIVRLAGSVEGYWRKKHAAERASQIDGVTGVVNELAVVPGAAIADGQVADDIMYALRRRAAARADVSADDIRLTVANGVVTVAGHVESSSGYRLVQDTIERTAGVTDVVNSVVIVAATH